MIRFSKISTLSFTILAASSLSGCGTFVPEIQEFPAGGPESQLLVEAIVHSIHCELRNSVNYIIDQDKKLAKLNQGTRNAAWFENWGVQVGLTLQIEEKTAINPTYVYLPPSPVTSIFTLAGGATLSSDALRIDKLNYFFTVKELQKQGTCPEDANANPTQGSLLIQSDLKTREWLLSVIMGNGTSEVNLPVGPSTVVKTNVLSHEVKFEVVSAGNITPAWKLVHWTVNQAGPFLGASRDRQHDLLLTFGPVDPKTLGPSVPVAQSFLASQIGLAVNNNRTAPLP
jgi:hypothetical protein